jgi:hypothetical protein
MGSWFARAGRERPSVSLEEQFIAGTNPQRPPNLVRDRDLSLACDARRLLHDRFSYSLLQQLNSLLMEVPKLDASQQLTMRLAYDNYMTYR